MAEAKDPLAELVEIQTAMLKQVGRIADALLRIEQRQEAMHEALNSLRTEVQYLQDDVQSVPAGIGRQKPG